MSHPLGPLADNLTAYAIYATAQTEMRRAMSLIESGQYEVAADEISSAARAAEVLAQITAPVDSDRSQRWLRVVAARRRFAGLARERATQPSLPSAA